MTASAEHKPSFSSSSRRALLAGALGSIGAVAVGAVGRASPVRAEGEAIVVGGEYTAATSRTYLENSANGDTVLQASSAGGIGMYGHSTWNIGVYGTSDASSGVYGHSSTYVGVDGQSGATDQPAVRGRSSGNSTGLLGISGPHGGAKPKTGVHGFAAQDSGSRGVWGETQTGQGVRGQATSGIGLYGRAWASGHALYVRGRFKAEQISGVATIPAGSTGVTISPGVKLNSSSFVLLTPKANMGSRSLWFTTNPGANTFRIRMNSARSTATGVAWLLMG